MQHMGVEYAIVPTEDPEIWEWRFQMQERSVSGRTRTRLRLLADRRVQLAIERRLKKARASS